MQNAAENVMSFTKARDSVMERATVEEMSSVTDLEYASDSERAGRLSQAIAAVQEAMDAAILAGLTVEPGFKRLANRFTSHGVGADSYLVSVHAYRKLI